MHNLASLDLNLLRVLRAVLERGSVTQAARQLGLSQSATSHALERLRGALQDPLLVRMGKRFVPTPRALELSQPLADAFALLDSALSPPIAFEPLQSRRTFRLATSDYAEFVLVPQLVERMRQGAPGIDLIVQPLSGTEDLPSLAVDAAIGLRQLAKTHAGIRSRPLFEETFSCLVRAGHPALGAPWTARNFAKAEHVMVSPTGTPGGIVDRALEAQGLSRRVVAQVPHFLVAPFLIPATDLVVTLPSRVAHAFARYLPLRVLDPPLAVPSFEMHLMWREADHLDPAKRWFRNEILTVAKAVRHGNGWSGVLEGGPPGDGSALRPPRKRAMSAARTTDTAKTPRAQRPRRGPLATE